MTHTKGRNEVTHVGRHCLGKRFHQNKSGMLSAFIIIGFILLALVALGLYASDSITKIFSGGPKYQVETFVKDCLLQTAEFGIILEGEQADPTNSLEDIQTSYQDFIAENLKKCTKDFTAFKDLNIQQGIPIAQVIFEQKSTKVSLRYSLDITKAQETYHLDTFSITLPVRFKILHEAAQYIYGTKQTTGGIDLTYLGERDFVTDVYEQGPTILFTDPRSKVNKQPYQYAFSP